MSPAGTVESAPQAPVAAAGPRTPLERAVVALRALLPATAQLAVGWRDATLGSHFLMEPVMQAGPARRLELALVEAGSLGNEPDTLSLAWHDAEDARLSLVARLGGPFDPAAREAQSRG